MLTYKRANLGVKIIIVRAPPDRNYDISCFPIGPRQMGIAVYPLSKALIAFRFCTRIGQTEAQVLPCAHARNNVSIPSYRGVEVRRPEALRASVSRTTIFIMPTLASVCSTGRPSTNGENLIFRWNALKFLPFVDGLPYYKLMPVWA